MFVCIFEHFFFFNNKKTIEKFYKLFKQNTSAFDYLLNKNLLNENCCHFSEKLMTKKNLSQYNPFDQIEYTFKTFCFVKSIHKSALSKSDRVYKCIFTSQSLICTLQC